MTRVMVIDDSAVVRQVVCALLEKYDDIEVIGSAPDPIWLAHATEATANPTPTAAWTGAAIRSAAAAICGRDLVKNRSVGSRCIKVAGSR